MNEVFKYDYYRMTGNSYSFSFKAKFRLFLYHQLKFMYLWRKLKVKNNCINRARLYRLTKKYGLEISLSATIGKGLYLGHPYNITVASDVVIGDNVNLHKGCTIGRENRGDRAGVPKIGNNVSVGINYTIVGKVNIGNDVMIAPNSFINFDVPDHSVVLGNPAKIHSKKYATKCYVNFLV